MPLPLLHHRHHRHPHRHLRRQQQRMLINNDWISFHLFFFIINNVDIFFFFFLSTYEIKQKQLNEKDVAVAEEAGDPLRPVLVSRALHDEERLCDNQHQQRVHKAIRPNFQHLVEIVAAAQRHPRLILGAKHNNQSFSAEILCAESNTGAIVVIEDVVADKDGHNRRAMVEISSNYRLAVQINNKPATSSQFGAA